VSVQGTLLLNSAFPGAGQMRLGQLPMGRLMLSIYLVLLIPGGAVWLSAESLVAVVAVLPAMAVSLWSQVELRRSLGVPLWPPYTTRSHVLDAIRGRDTFYPNDRLQSAPERPTD
jgi:hypothetical protein